MTEEKSDQLDELEKGLHIIGDAFSELSLAFDKMGDKIKNSLESGDKNK